MRFLVFFSKNFLYHLAIPGYYIYLYNTLQSVTSAPHILLHKSVRLQAYVEFLERYCFPTTFFPLITCALICQDICLKVTALGHPYTTGKILCLLQETACEKTSNFPDIHVTKFNCNPVCQFLL